MTKHGTANPNGYTQAEIAAMCRAYSKRRRVSP
jgi:hypothetical protein